MSQLLNHQPAVTTGAGFLVSRSHVISRSEGSLMVKLEAWRGVGAEAGLSSLPLKDSCRQPVPCRLSGIR